MESPRHRSGCFLPTWGAVTSACASKTRAQHTSTGVRTLALRANFRKSKRYVSIKPFQKRERILFLLMEQVAPSNLESGNISYKHLHKGRWNVKSASVSWQYRCPGIHPESCSKSPRHLGPSIRPKPPDSAGNQWPCGQIWERQRWWINGVTGRKPGSLEQTSPMNTAQNLCAVALEHFDSSNKLEKMPSSFEHSKNHQGWAGLFPWQLLGDRAKCLQGFKVQWSKGAHLGHSFILSVFCLTPKCGGLVRLGRGPAACVIFVITAIGATLQEQEANTDHPATFCPNTQSLGAPYLFLAASAYPQKYWWRE